MQVVQPLAHIDKPVRRDLARLTATRAVFELQQLRHFIEAEADALCRLDEAHAGRVVRTVATDATLRALGPKPWNAAYVQPCRRPTDGRYGENPNRLQHYYQYQVVMKPAPDDFQELYLGSLKAIGIDPAVHDIRFVQDNWESPTLGAWGLGWEVWLNGMEVTQFTYFQQAGGLECRPVLGEITYGLERLAMYLQNVDSIFDLLWTDVGGRKVTYGEVFHQNEVEQSTYNFEHADTSSLFAWFDTCESEAGKLVDLDLPLPA